MKIINICTLAFILLLTGCQTTGPANPTSNVLERDNIKALSIEKDRVNVVGERQHYVLTNGDIADLQDFIKSRYAKNMIYNRIEFWQTNNQLGATYIVYLNPRTLNSKAIDSLDNRYGFSRDYDAVKYIPDDLRPMVPRGDIPLRRYSFDAQKMQLPNVLAVNNKSVLVRPQETEIIDLDYTLNAQANSGSSVSAMQVVGAVAAVAAAIWLVDKQIEDNKKEERARKACREKYGRSKCP